MGRPLSGLAACEHSGIHPTASRPSRAVATGPCGRGPPPPLTIHVRSAHHPGLSGTRHFERDRRLRVVISTAQLTARGVDPSAAGVADRDVHPRARSTRRTADPGRATWADRRARRGVQRDQVHVRTEPSRDRCELPACSSVSLLVDHRPLDRGTTSRSTRHAAMAASSRASGYRSLGARAVDAARRRGVEADREARPADDRSPGAGCRGRAPPWTP